MIKGYDGFIASGDQQEKILLWVISIAAILLMYALLKKLIF